MTDVDCSIVVSRWHNESFSPHFFSCVSRPELCELAIKFTNIRTGLEGLDGTHDLELWEPVLVSGIAHGLPTNRSHDASHQLKAAIHLKEKRFNERS